jgi:GntR family transcriptional regulator, rspAB operon transcriptional repressor
MKAQKTVDLVIKPPVSLREKVYGVIRNNIFDGVIAPGTRIKESRIAKEIKTSRTPVREALHILEKEGLLESIPRVGYRVKEIKWTEVAEICEIRIANETLAASWAIDRITPKYIKMLEDNLARSEAVIKSQDPLAFVAHDTEFHEILSRASGSERLWELCQLLHRNMLRYRMRSYYTKASVQKALEGHHQIFASIKLKDKAKVATAIRDHLKWVQKDIKEKVFSDQQSKS